MTQRLWWESRRKNVGWKLVEILCFIRSSATVAKEKHTWSPAWTNDWSECPFCVCWGSILKNNKDPIKTQITTVHHSWQQIILTEVFMLVSLKTNNFWEMFYVLHESQLHFTCSWKHSLYRKIITRGTQQIKLFSLFNENKAHFKHLQTELNKSL